MLRVVALSEYHETALFTTGTASRKLIFVCPTQLCNHVVRLSKGTPFDKKTIAEQLLKKDLILELS